MNSFKHTLDELRADAIKSILDNVRKGAAHVDGLGFAFPQRTPLSIEGGYVKFNGMPSTILSTEIIVKAADTLNGLLQ